MPAANIEIRDQQVLRALNALLAAADNTDGALQQIGATVTESIRLGFDDSTDPYGRPWKSVLRGGQPLRDTGNLANSWTYALRGDAVAIGSNLEVEYDGRRHNLATIHQYGATIRPRKAKALRFSVGGHWATAQAVTIPPRRMVPDRGWPDDWRDEVTDIVAAHIDGAIQ